MDKEGVNLYEREKLYEEVWSKPVTHVAKDYGVSDVAIHKICKSMNIPTPPNGYWAKLKHGKEVKKVPLPPAEKEQSLKYGIKSINLNTNVNSNNSNSLSFLSVEEQEKIYNVALSLKIDSGTNLCKEVIEYKKIVDEWNKHHDSIENSSYSYKDYKYHYNFVNHKYVGVPVLAGVISEKGLERVYKILNCLIGGLKQLGYSVNDDMSFQVKGEKVEFYIREKQNEVEHILTEEERNKLKNYEKEVKHNKWAIKPLFQTYDNPFNGELLFNTKKNYYIKDGKNASIENHIPDMLIQLIQQSEVLRIERLEKEDKERRRQEELYQRNLPAITFNEEVDKVTCLLQEVQDFERAEKIRKYISKVQANDINNEKSEWIKWGYSVADWYDPIVKKKNPQFGERKHDEDPIPEEKYIYSW